MKHTIKKQSVFAALVVLTMVYGFFVCTPIAFAHEELQDGRVRATLYFDPHHDPEATVPTTINFDFLDTSSSFDISTWKFSIMQNNTEVFQGTLKAGTVQMNDGVAHFLYTFPTTGNYTATATGMYKGKTYTLTSPIEVVGVGQAPAEPEVPDHHYGLAGHLLHIIILGGGLIVATVLVLRANAKEKRAKLLNHTK